MLGGDLAQMGMSHCLHVGRDMPGKFMFPCPQSPSLQEKAFRMQGQVAMYLELPEDRLFWGEHLLICLLRYYNPLQWSTLQWEVDCGSILGGLILSFTCERESD